MDDYLDEDDQWEAVKRWLKENLPWMATGVVLGLGLLYGWRWWQERKTTHAHEAAGMYAQMTADLQANRAKAQATADRLLKDYAHTPYADKAELVLARAEVEQGEFDKAAARLKAVLERTKDEPLKQVVRLRLARVLLAQNKPDEALAALGPFKGQEDAFASSYNEVRGDILLAKGDRSGALAAYKEAVKAGEPGGGGESQSLFRPNDDGDSQLQLKLNDLLAAADAEPASQPQPPKPAPTSENKP